MRTRSLTICTALTACTVASAAARAETVDDVLKKMKDKYAGYKTIQYNSNTNSDMSMSGMTMKSVSDMSFQAARKDGKILSRMESTTKSTTKMGDQPETKT